MPEPTDPEKKLESFLSSIEKAGSESPFSFLSGEKAKKEAPTEAAKPSTSHPAVETSLKNLEQELMREKERALRAEILLKERENVHLEMENVFKTLKEQLRLDQMNKEMDQERLSARARVETLEKRLEEMNRLLVDMMRKREKREAAGEQDPKILELRKTCDQLRESVERRDKSLTLLKENFEAEKRDLIQNLAEKHNTLTQCLAELQRLRTERDEALSGQSDLWIKAEAVRRELEERRSHLAKMEEDLKESRIAQEVLREESSSHQVKVSRLMDEHREALGRLAQESADSLKVQQDQLAEKYRAESAVLRRDLSDSRQKIADLMNLVHALELERSEQAQKIRELIVDGEKKDLKAQEGEVLSGELKQTCERLEAEKRERDQALARLEADYRMIAERYHQSIEEIERAKNEALEQLRLSHAAAMKEVQEKLTQTAGEAEREKVAIQGITRRLADQEKKEAELSLKLMQLSQIEKECRAMSHTEVGRTYIVQNLMKKLKEIL